MTAKSHTRVLARGRPVYKHVSVIVKGLLDFLFVCVCLWQGKRLKKCGRFNGAKSGQDACGHGVLVIMLCAGYCFAIRPHAGRYAFGIRADKSRLLGLLLCNTPERRSLCLWHTRRFMHALVTYTLPSRHNPPMAGTNSRCLLDCMHTNDRHSGRPVFHHIQACICHLHYT